MAHAYYTAGQVQLDIERNRRLKPIHQPLDSNHGQIRVLRIIPTPSDQEIRGRLSEVRIGPSTKYTALSYQWGSAQTKSDIVPILIDNQTFWVRKNLWQFLDRVRKNPLLCRRHFWIDAICINQAANDTESLHEKSHQVNMMNLIYGKAHEVICWLGEPDSVLKHDLSHLEAYFTHPVTARREAYAISALERLMNLPYWTRIWIVQEVVLAKRTVLVCGTFAFEWHRFLDLWDEQSCQTTRFKSTARRLFSNTRRILSSARRSDKEKPASTVPPWIEWGRAEQIIQWSNGTYPGRPSRPEHVDTSASLSFIKVLKTFEHQECSNPHDKVYGLLGLMDRKVLMPNYTKSIEELCDDVVDAVDSTNAHLSQIYDEWSRIATKHNRRRADIRRFVRYYLGLDVDFSIRHEGLDDLSDVDGASANADNTLLVMNITPESLAWR